LVAANSFFAGMVAKTANPDVDNNNCLLEISLTGTPYKNFCEYDWYVS